jgi:hypothetical protein
MSWTLTFPDGKEKCFETQMQCIEVLEQLTGCKIKQDGYKIT